MRTISAAGLAKLASKLGGVPVTIIAVQWTEGGSIYEYADSDIESSVVGLDHFIPGKIQNISGIDNVITVQGTGRGTSGDSQELSVTLDDIDGSIKAILDQNDVHKRACWVYQWFDALDYTDRFLLIKGQVSSPITWSQKDRTVTFDIINRIEDSEIGFSIEEGNFNQVSPDLIGKAWPLAFGTVVHVPALQTRSPYSGILQQGFGIRDFTLQPRIDQLAKMCCPLVFRGMSLRLTLGGQVSDAVFAEDPSCFCRRQSEKAGMEAALAAQIPFEYSTIKVIGGTVFPQGKNVRLNICESIVTGKFQGTNANPSETFKINRRQHPESIGTTIPKIKNFVNLCGIRQSQTFGGNNDYSLTGGTYSTRDDLLFKPTTCGDTDVNSDGFGWEWYATFPVEDFFWAEPGCEVFEESNTQIVYIANLLPSTILRVAAYRTFESTGKRVLVTVPPSFYSTRLTDYNGYIVTEIVFSKPLSRQNVEFEDDIYVSMTSTVGPNTVDILEWLITKYTNFTFDSTFATVKTKIDNYPSNFAMLERKNILEVLRDIAFQARCALVLRDDVFSIVYLSEEPSVDFTITESDIVPGSFILTHTETEDLVTELVAEWRGDYAKEERIGKSKFIIRYNFPRYGTHKDTFDFSIYNIQQLVRKSATFWLIRMANTWRRIKVKTTLSKLQAEVLDCCEVTLPDFSPNPIKCLVDSATYDSDSNTIDFELWTPVRSGEQDKFLFSWPAQIEITDFWPTLDDRLNRIAGGGQSPNVDVTPPSSSPLALPPGFTVNVSPDKGGCQGLEGGISASGKSECREDQGDQKPSDKDDQKPTKKVEGEGEGAKSANATPGKAAKWVKNEFVNNNNQQDQVNRNTATGTSGQETAQFDDTGTGANNSGSDGDGLQKQLDDLPSTDDFQDCTETDCAVTVRVGYINVTAVRKTNGIADSSDGAVGKVIGNATVTNFEEMTFNSLCSAQQYVARMQQITDSYSASVGGGNWPAPGNASITKTCWSLSCEEPDEPNAVGYKNDVTNGNGTAATQGLMDNDRKFKDVNDNDINTSNYGPC